jgi:hypothetical protein
VAFGTLAVEGRMQRKRNDPNLAVDYSEAHLFYWHTSSEGRTRARSTGEWWPDRALKVFRNNGVMNDACYSYTVGIRPAGACAPTTRAG